MATEVFETIEGPMGVMVSLGLAKPSSRAITAAAITGTLAYAFKFPQSSFRRDGTMKPMSALSSAPDSTNKHFLLVPLGFATIVYFCT